MKLKSILTAFAALALVTCAPEPVRVSQITLNTKALTLKVGDTERLTAVVSPYNADNPTIIWSSDNASIAKVSDGTVTAVSPGTAKITAKADDGGMSDACVVTVLMPVKGVSLDRTTLSMYEGGTDQLVATVTPENADDASLLWTSSAPDVVLVTTEGKLLALAPGKADITVTTVDGGFSAACKVTVQEVKMELKPPTLDILIGDESDIQVTLENQLEGVSVNIRWYSTDESIVTVDDKGHVKALALGDAVICAATEKGKTAFCKVHVRDRITSVDVKAPDGAKVVSVGSTLQLTAEVTPSDLPGMEITWKSSDTSVATVSADGLVSGKSQGTVTITVTVKNGPETKTVDYEIAVVKPVTKVSVTPSTLELYVGDVIDMGKSLTVTVEPADTEYAGFKYTTSTPGIISVSEGKIEGVKVGSVTLYITPNSANPDKLKAEVKVTVKAKVEGITIQGGDTRTISVKKTVQLKATITPSNASQEVTWSSSKPAVATVNANGLVTGVTAGTAEITATSKDDPSFKDVCTVTVNNIPVSSVELDKTTLSLTEGETYTLKATVKPDDAADKTPTWTSSNTAVATVSSEGVVTAVKAGTATITAKCGEKTATCTVTVQAKFVNVTGVTLDKETMSLGVGSSAQLTATVLPANANNKALKWSVSSSAVSVTSQGNVATVTARSAGEATVTVETIDGGFTKECKVTVFVPVTSITLSQTSATIAYGQTLSLTATVAPTNATDPTLEWSSDKPTVASVTDGVVKAGSTAGTATITAKSKSNPSVTATCKVTVKSEIILVNKITISPSSLNLSLNETAKLTATISPSNADDKTIIWSVPQGAVASVDQNGNVTAVREGQSRIIAKSADGNAQAWVSVVVTKVAVTGFALSPTTLTLKVGETYDLQTTFVPSNASIRKVSWSSKSTSVATVDANGRVTAKAAGTATIVAKPTDATSLQKECTVTVLGSGTGTGGAEGIDFEDWNF
jgi:uncharacterized protein YjdB